MDSRITATVNRTTAFVNQSGLRVTPRKQDGFQSVVCTRCYHDVRFTPVVPASLENQMAAQALADEIPSAKMTPYFPDLTVTRDPAWNEEEIPMRLSTRDRHELPRRAEPDASATTVLKSSNSSASLRAS